MGYELCLKGQVEIRRVEVGKSSSPGVLRCEQKAREQGIVEHGREAEVPVKGMVEHQKG